MPSTIVFITSTFLLLLHFHYFLLLCLGVKPKCQQKYGPSYTIYKTGAQIFYHGNLKWLNHLAESSVKEGRSGLCNNQCSALSLTSEAHLLRGLLWYPICKCRSSLFLPRAASAFICSRPSLGMARGVRDLSCRLAASFFFPEMGLWVWKEEE